MKIVEVFEKHGLWDDTIRIGVWVGWDWHRHLDFRVAYGAVAISQKRHSSVRVVHGGRSGIGVSVVYRFLLQAAGEQKPIYCRNGVFVFAAVGSSRQWPFNPTAEQKVAWFLRKVFVFDLRYAANLVSVAGAHILASMRRFRQRPCSDNARGIICFYSYPWRRHLLCCRIAG